MGLLGKPNVGKTTFFVASTMKPAEIADFPFTTLEPNLGIAYLKIGCVCKEFKVEDEPRNSLCVNGNRLIPVKLVDIPGLVEGASRGRGKGNKFLDSIRQADALIHVVDASGTTDSEGRHLEVSNNDPLRDVEIVEQEFDLWIYSVVQEDLVKAIKTYAKREKVIEMLCNRLSGLSISEDVIKSVFERFNSIKNFISWKEKEIFDFVSNLRRLSKPSVIAANKCDLPSAESNIRRLEGTGRNVIPCSAEGELLLRRAHNSGLIDYEPGASSFQIIDSSRLSAAQLKALELVRERVLLKYGSTGVQKIINFSYFGLLKSVVVFPVEDEKKLTDSKGHILPDAYVMKEGSTVLDLAKSIHSDLANNFLYAIDVRTGLRLGSDYVLKDRDVIKIVASK